MGLVFAFVCLSSIAGLLGAAAMVSPFLLIFFPEFVAEVWEASLLADVVFVVGSIASALLGGALAMRRFWLIGALVGGLVTWLTYGLSVWIMGSTGAEIMSATSDGDFFGSLFFAGFAGGLGIIFAATAPALWARLELKRMKQERTVEVEFTLAR